MITFEEAKNYAKDFKVVPICEKILADVKTPMEVLKILKNVLVFLFIKCYTINWINVE